jgi:16S rRNA (guanine966-N2)-methyltransferase
MFSAIGPIVEGSRVLDLFAGTGAFGLEAISRGAMSALFVEKDRKAVFALSGTVKSLGIEQQALVMCTTAPRALVKLAGSETAFRIIFMDPPYHEDVARKLILDPFFLSLLELGGLLIVERGSRTAAYEVPPELVRFFERRYGDTAVEIFRKESSDK